MKEYDKKLDDKQRDLILALMGSVEYAKGNVTAILPFTNGIPDHLVREFCMFHADDVIRGARKLVPNTGKSAMDIVTHFIVSSGKKPRQDPDPHTADGWNAKDFDKDLKADLIDLAHGKDLTVTDGKVSPPEPPAAPDPNAEPVVVVSAKDINLKRMTPVAVATPRRGRPPKTVEIGPRTPEQKKHAVSAARIAAKKITAAPVAKRKEHMDAKDALKGEALLEAVREDARKSKEAAVEEMKPQEKDPHWVDTGLSYIGIDKGADQAKIGDGAKERDPQIPKADDWIPDPPPAKPESKEWAIPIGVDTFIKNMNDMLKPRRPASLIDYRPLLVAVMDRIGSGEMQITNLRVDETIGSITIDYRRIPA